MDEVEIESVLGLGTKVKMKKMINKIPISDDEDALISLGGI